MKTWIKRACVSFAISSFAGMIVNLLIDLIVIGEGGPADFCSVSPWFVEMFPTKVIAVYVNVVLYGLIGATFASMAFVFEIERLGFLIQYLIYFCLSSVILAGITMGLWKLHRVPQALVFTVAGYGISFLIMGLIQYRKARKDIKRINELIA